MNNNLSSEDKSKLILILGLMAFLANGDNYAAAPLLLNISKDLDIPMTRAAISVTSYMLSYGLFTIFFGPLADRYGKVRIINTAAIGTAIFSMLGAITFNLPSLIFFRAMNGAFGAGIFPVTVALIGESFEGKNRQIALGKIMGFMFLGGASATAIGGFLAYLGSWRLVYFVYGFLEILLAIAMYKVLKRDKPVVSKLNIAGTYREIFQNSNFMKLLFVEFATGYTIYGIFTYSGQLIEGLTGLNILLVGLILSNFGIGIFIGGKVVPTIKEKFKNNFFILVGVSGSFSLFTLTHTSSPVLLCLGFLGFGLSFAAIQSNIMLTAQEKLPHIKGAVMSAVSFCMLVGGAVGTAINGKIIESIGVINLFKISIPLFLVVGILVNISIVGFERRKSERLYS